MKSELKAVLALGVFAVVSVSIVWLSPEDGGWDDDEYDQHEEQIWSEDYYRDSQPEPLITIDLARSRYERCQDPDQYCSEYTVIDTYVLAVREDPEVFDEASEVFNSFLLPDTRSAIYLKVMQAYVELIEVHQAALDNYLNSFDAWLAAGRESSELVRLDDWDIDQAFYGFKKAWEVGEGDDRLVHKVMDFESYFEFVVKNDDGFDSTVRYSEEYLQKLAMDGGMDPFWCSPLSERLDHLLWLANIRGDTVKSRKWMLHLADYYATLHICEDGHPRPEPERAFQMYTNLGMTKDAQDAAWIVVSDAVNSFVFGGDAYAPWREDPAPCDSDVLAHLLLWYPRTGISAEDQVVELYALAGASEDVGYLDAALKIYELLEEHDDAARIRPLAEKNPRPPDHVQLEHFFMRLENAESHLHETP
tara:strand:- start:188 stop:1444 length:1257 start_codon:yes stop_codon:yes gene_type:complete